MVERLMYEVPYASFGAAQVDVLTEFRQVSGESETRCLLTTRVTRELAAYADWEQGDAEAILAAWVTQEARDDRWVDPDLDAIIHPGAPEAICEAEQALGTHPALDQAEKDEQR
jgi:hypothetical protein